MTARLERSSLPTLLAITDSGAGPLRDVAAALARGGAEWIQLREKSKSDRELYLEVAAIRRQLPEHVVLFVNDRPDIALAAGAEGVHLGDEDLPPAAARQAAGTRGLIIGASSHSLEQAVAISADDAVDYVAIGPIFRSSTKNVRDPLGPAVIAAVRKQTAKPIVAIGGIGPANVRQVLDAGADCAAVVAALYENGEIEVNVRRFLDVTANAR